MRAMAAVSAYKANGGSLGYPREASFSSYLDTAERDLAESIHSPPPGPEASTPRVSLGRSRIPRSELGVFKAERYFNENLENKKSPTPRREGGGRRHSREKRDELSERKSSKSTGTTRSSSTSSAFKSPTPSPRSEASWNSQLGLLPLPKKAGVGLRIFSGFQCKGSCFNKKSVRTAASIHLSVQSPRFPPPGNGQYRKSRLSHQDHFAFPMIDTASSPQNHYNKNQKYLDQGQPRKSLQVFGFHHIGKQDIADNLERKLSLLAWDTIPNSSPNAIFSFPLPNDKTKTTSLTCQGDDDHQDAMSDASSDLFEIEHLLGISTMGPNSQASNKSAYMTSTAMHCYEPSEAGIEWRVVATSAIDFSAASDSDHEKITAPAITTKKISPESGLFVGCTSHKAVECCRE